jgi:hypothetical protein
MMNISEKALNDQRLFVLVTAVADANLQTAILGNFLA